MQTPGLQTAGAVAVLRKNSAAILPVEESEEMSMEKITITEKQKEIIRRLNDPHYTVEILQEWVNRNDNVFVNAPSALEAIRETDALFEELFSDYLTKERVA